MKKSIYVCAAVFFVLISLFINVPDAAFAQESLNSDVPEIKAVYYDENGKKANGNELASGNYRMQLVLSGLSSVSEMEFTAALSDAVVINSSWCCDLSAENADIASLCKVSAGSLIICIASLNEACSSISSDETVLFSADITVSSPVPLDMESVITENESPDFTFAETNYGDVNTSSVPYTYSCYGFAGGTAVSSAVLNVTEMKFDMSPVLPSVFSVKGRVAAMLDPNSPDNSNGAPLLPNVDVLINNAVVATTDDNGIFEIKNLESGTYNAVLHYANGYDRNIKIIVNGDSIDYTGTPITMVPCDYDNNGYINVSDTNEYFASLKSGILNIGDIDKNGFINVSDTNIYFSFVKIADVRSLYTEIVIN